MSPAHTVVGLALWATAGCLSGPVPIERTAPRIEEASADVPGEPLTVLLVQDTDCARLDLGEATACLQDEGARAVWTFGDLTAAPIGEGILPQVAVGVYVVMANPATRMLVVVTLAALYERAVETLGTASVEGRVYAFEAQSSDAVAIRSVAAATLVTGTPEAQAWAASMDNPLAGTIGTVFPDMATDRRGLLARLSITQLCSGALRRFGTASTLEFEGGTAVVVACHFPGFVLETVPDLAVGVGRPIDHLVVYNVSPTSAVWARCGPGSCGEGEVPARTPALRDYVAETVSASGQLGLALEPAGPANAVRIEQR